MGRNLNGVIQRTISYGTSNTVQLKPMIKAHSSGRMFSSGISGVVIASVHSEKTRLKKLMIMIIIMMNKSQEMMLFCGRQKLTSTMKLRPDMEDFS